MMDNYEQARLSAERIKNIDDIHQINFPEKSEFFDRVDKFDVKTQNFNFGANILSATTMNTSSSSEVETKTNTEKEIKTIKSTPAATEDSQISSTIAVEEVDGSVSDEQESSQCCAGETENAYEAEEDEDSYQTDNDNSQLSQEDGNFAQTSKDLNDEEDEDNPDEDSDESSSDSDFSDLSGLSDMSGREWKPINQRPLNWVQKQIHSGVNPREILSKFLPSSAQRISPELTDMTLWRILASMLSEPPRRKKLSYVNTFDDVIDLVEKSKNIIVLTGAGVSVSCGIPDFRSSDGIYSRLAKDYPNLPDPQAMFDINYFSRDPRPFFKFAREIYPGQFKPSPCHRFIKMLEQKQKLLRNYTQNIDTLEQVAGIQNVIECHGSFSTASCTKCKYKCDADSIRADIFAQRIPACPRCQPNVEQSVDASQPVSEMELRLLVENGIMKPDIVFFGEGLPDEFHTVMGSDKDKCDLLIVMGSSLKVRPVALIPSSIPNNVPQILINREQLHHLEFDVELLGDGDVIINQLCHRLGGEFKDICFNEEILQESSELINVDDDDDDEEEEVEKSVQITIDDSASIKSTQSADSILQPGNVYSDSGFESSSTSSKKDGEFLPPDYLEEPMETTGFGGSCDYRHLSIDSSKDSGILGDASNSALPPAFNSFAETSDLKKSLNMPASSTHAISSNTTTDNLHNTKTVDTNCSETEKQSLRRQQRHQSAAERLQKGTYYAYELSSSYVFPGAQVSWSSDSEDDDDCELTETNGKHLAEAEEDGETNPTLLSPLMTPSVENEMVKGLATSNANASTSNSFTNAISTCNAVKTVSSSSSPQKQNKRHSNDAEECNTLNATDPLAETDSTSTHSPPPHKKRRDSADANSTNTTPSSSFSSACTSLDSTA